jgi:ribonuclease PH
MTDFARERERMVERREIARDPIHGAVAAVSVGIYRGTPVLDLDYAEDSTAEVDFNVVMSDDDRFVEVQGTAEGAPFDRGALEVDPDTALLLRGSSGR